MKKFISLKKDAVKRTVTTKNELKEVMKENVETFVVTGELAKKLKNSSVLSKLPVKKLAIIIGALAVCSATAPGTAGISYVAAGGVAAMSGLEISTIILASSLGISLILSVFKGYDVKWKATKDGTIEGEFTKK